MWYADEGITFKCQALYTKEQNGGAERSRQTLIEQLRSMQLEASLPPSLGLEAFLTTSYILNWIPNKQLGWKNLYKVTYGKLPSLTHIHKYGCKTYTLNKQVRKGDKLAPYISIGHLVGYNLINIYQI